MDANFLQQILAGVQPEDGSANPYVGQQAPLAPPPQAAPQPVAVPGADPAASNVLQMIIAGGGNPQGPAADAAPVPQAPPAPQGYAPLEQAPQPQQDTARPRVRSSLLDHIGRLADVFATVGGANPLYQPTLDKNQQRQFASDDHARGVQDQTQKFQIGQNTLSDHTTKQMGLLARGLGAIQAAGGDPNAALPGLAQQLGIDPAHTAEIAAHLKADPTLLGGLNAALNAPKNEGTDAKEKQIYDLIQAHDPVAAQSYLKSLSDPKAMTPAETARLGIATQRLNLDTKKYDSSRTDADRNFNLKANPPPKPGKDGGDPYTAYNAAVQGAQTIYQRLATLRQSGDIDRATGLVQSQLSTQARANLRAAVAEIKGKVVPQAVSTLKQSGLARPAQAEVLATANGMVSDLERYDQTPAQYRDKLDHAMTFFAGLKQNLDSAALRSGVVKPRGAPAAASAAPGAGKVFKYNPATGKIE